MLILSAVHPQKWPELIDRWESNVVKVIESISYTLNMAICKYEMVLLVLL